MRPSQVPPPGSARVLTDDEAPDFLESSRVAVLAFLDPAEESSRAMRARLDVVAAKLADVRLAVGVVDVSAHRLVAEALGVRAVPFVAVFAAGELVDHIVGSPPVEVVEEAVRVHLAR